MHEFTKLLRSCQRKGKLTVGDLRQFFARDYHTVREWAIHGRIPTGPRIAQASKQLQRLEELIATKDGFPVPIDLSKRDRAAYMRRLGNGRKRADARLPATRAAAKRVVRRVRQAGQSAKTVGGADYR